MYTRMRERKTERGKRNVPVLKEARYPSYLIADFTKDKGTPSNVSLKWKLHTKQRRILCRLS